MTIGTMPNKHYHIWVVGFDKWLSFFLSIFLPSLKQNRLTDFFFLYQEKKRIQNVYFFPQWISYVVVVVFFSKKFWKKFFFVKIKNVIHTHTSRSNWELKVRASMTITTILSTLNSRFSFMIIIIIIDIVDICKKKILWKRNQKKFSNSCKA